MKMHNFLAILLAVLAPLATSQEIYGDYDKPNIPESDVPPTIDTLLSYAFQQQDLEGSCATQACETMNPDHVALCTQDKIATDRPQCAKILQKSGLKKHENVKLAQGMEEKIKQAMALAEGIATPEMAREMMRQDKDFDVEKMYEMIKEAKKRGVMS